MAEGTRLPGFGDPASIKQLADTAERTTKSLEELKELVRTDVSDTLRKAFEGQAANSFERFADRLGNILIPGGGVGSPTRVYHEKVKPAADAMGKARELLAAAEQYNSKNGLYIRPDLTVEAVDLNRPDAQAVAAIGQGKLDVARKAADNARRLVQVANEDFAKALAMTEKQLEGLGMVSGGGRGRAAGAKPRAAKPSQLNSKALTSKDEAFKVREEADAKRDKKLDDLYTLHNDRGAAYRSELAKTYAMPQDGRTYVGHHNFPVKNAPDFRRVGIDTTNPVWGSWVEESHHQSFSKAYEQAWDQFWLNKNRSPQEVFDFARGLARTNNYKIGF